MKKLILLYALCALFGALCGLMLLLIGRNAIYFACGGVILVSCIVLRKEYKTTATREIWRILTSDL